LRRRCHHASEVQQPFSTWFLSDVSWVKSTVWRNDAIPQVSLDAPPTAASTLYLSFHIFTLRQRQLPAPYGTIHKTY
jgi:hypothetical protein